MKTDTLIRCEGMEVLAKNLGLVDAERFIMLIHKEPFDYTKWQENLFEGMTVEEISNKAMEYRKNNSGRGDYTAEKQARPPMSQAELERLEKTYMED